MYNQITYESIYKRDDICFVDVRTPDEYSDAHIPGAISLPILANAEHVRVSTEYMQGDKEQAKSLGVRYASARLPEIHDRIREMIANGQQVVLYCWRGGYRSHALFSLLSGLGLPVCKLSGGYKAYRRFVNRSWSAALEGKKWYALYGDTGTGKTMLLTELEGMGARVIDLEKLAVHRGSLLGGIGLPPQPSQKMFEGHLQKSLFSLPVGPVFVEGESRKIGALILPQPVYSALQNAQKIHITSTIETRMHRLEKEYAHHSGQEITQAIDSLQSYIGKETVRHLLNEWHAGRTENVIRNLLERYYDPKYRFRRKEYFAEVRHEDSVIAAQEIIDRVAKDQR